MKKHLLTILLDLFQLFIYQMNDKHLQTKNMQTKNTDVIEYGDGLPVVELDLRSMQYLDGRSPKYSPDTPLKKRSEHRKIRIADLLQRSPQKEEARDNNNANFGLKRFGSFDTLKRHKGGEERPPQRGNRSGNNLTLRSRSGHAHSTSFMNEKWSPIEQRKKKITDLLSRSPQKKEAADNNNVNFGLKRFGSFDKLTLTRHKGGEERPFQRGTRSGNNLIAHSRSDHAHSRAFMNGKRSPIKRRLFKTDSFRAKIPSRVEKQDPRDLEQSKRNLAAMVMAEFNDFED
jgi:hypothetical protein